MNKYILGVDPGRSKTGLALTDGRGNILRLLVAESGHIEKDTAEFLQDAVPDCIIIGDGTNSSVIGRAITKILPGVPLHMVEESYSTEEARSLYWEVNPPRGWKKLVPLGLLVPDVPLDAYAAVVQVRRWLQASDR